MRYRVTILIVRGTASPDHIQVLVPVSDVFPADAKHLSRGRSFMAINTRRAGTRARGVAVYAVDLTRRGAFVTIDTRRIGARACDASIHSEVVA